MNMQFWSWVFFSFNGRVSRMYYWITAAVFFGLYLIFMMPAMALAAGGDANLSPLTVLLMLPVMAFSIWAGLAVAIKRWHDRGKSGWWVLIGFIPIVGPIWALVECGFLSGTAGVNQYGVENVPPSSQPAISVPDASSPWAS